MTRIDAKFAELKAEGKKAFVSYIMAGDPDYDTSLEIVKALPKAGVDIIELGLPFTDPMADGETIQLAGQRAAVWRGAGKAVDRVGGIALGGVRRVHGVARRRHDDVAVPQRREQQPNHCRCQQARARH